MNDVISRQALRDAMYHEAFETDTEMQRWDSGCWIRYKLFENVIDHLPSVQQEPERNKGKWVDDKGLYRCSVCNHLWSELWWTSIVPLGRMCEIMKYCPNCGADMNRRTE